MKPRPKTVEALARVGGSLYADHVARFGNGQACGCEVRSSDPSCDVGEALWRVQLAELVPREREAAR